MPPSIRRLGLLLPLVFHFLSQAVAEDTLPQPLTLEAALARADLPAPELDLAVSGQAAAEAVREEADSRRRLRLDLEGRLRWGDPLGAGYSRNDSAFTLVARRRLTDFGRTRAALEAGDAEVRAAALRHRWTRWQRRLDILDAYLDVQNLTNHRVAEPLITGFGESSPSYGFGLPILPIFGVEAVLPEP